MTSAEVLSKLVGGGRGRGEGGGAGGAMAIDVMGCYFFSMYRVYPVIS